MTTVREELGEMFPSIRHGRIQKGFEAEFGIRFKEDEPDTWEKESIQTFIRDRYTKPEWIFSTSIQVQDGVAGSRPGRLARNLPFPVRRLDRERRHYG